MRHRPFIQSRILQIGIWLVLSIALQACSSTDPASEPTRLPLPPNSDEAELADGHIPFNVDNPSVAKIAKIKTNIDAHLKSGKKLSEVTPRMKAIAQSASLKPTDVIADIGCGTGFFEFTLIENGIPFKKLYAQDLNPYALEIMNYGIAQLGHSGKEKIIRVLGEARDTNLKKNSLDWAFVIQVSVFIAKTSPRNEYIIGEGPIQTLRTVYRALKKQGKLLVFNSQISNPAADNGTEEGRRYAYRQAGFKLLQTQMLPEYDAQYSIYSK